jgi:hypothetical protein
VGKLIFLLGVLLSACGGGSSTNNPPPPSNAVTQQLAKTTSANTSVVPNDVGAAMATVLSTTQKLVAGAQASQTYSCIGGGTATYTVSGGTSVLQTNGQLDAGETFSVTFNKCSGALGASSINGSITMVVTSASSGNVAISTVTNGLVITTDHGTVTLSGSSTLQQTTATQGTTTTVTNRFTAPIISVTTAYTGRNNARNSTFTLTNVDITQTVTTNNGVVTGSTYSGTSTLSATLPNGAFDITTATQGIVTFDANGNPTQGTWIITLPGNRIVLTIASNTASLGVDYGNDGTIDVTYTFTIADLKDEAG